MVNINRKNTLELPEPIDLDLYVRCRSSEVEDDYILVERCVICHFSSTNPANNKLQCSLNREAMKK